MLASVCKPRIDGESDATGTACNIAKKELELFGSEPAIPLSGNPLAWWSKKHHRFPHIAKFAVSDLAVQGTSVPSERLFSKAGQLISDRRASLKPSNVDKLLFLNQNIDQ